MSIIDWRQALSTPPVYRVGNSSLRIQTHIVYFILVVGICVLTLWYFLTPTPTASHPSVNILNNINGYNPYLCEQMSVTPKYPVYNNTYPMTTPVKVGSEIMFRIGVVSDLDTDSKSLTEKNTWFSYFKKGHLTWSPLRNTIHIQWDAGDPAVLKTSFSSGGRGMELSELIVFNGKLLAPDDRTGIIYQIDSGKAIPWVLLTNGNGKNSKGFKSEWAAVKDQTLYVGGVGKEWTTPTGELENYDPQWLKTISTQGEVSHHNWQSNYLKLRQTVGIEFPGYMIHESAAWSNIHKKWYFLPRRSSKEKYHEDTDAYKGTNVLLTTDENFNNVEVTYIGEVLPTHGFSSFKFIPGANDEVIVALRSEETKEGSSTYIMAFTTKGNIILPESKFADVKYEGLEFI